MMVGGAVLAIVLTALATLVVPVRVTAQTSGPILRLEMHPLEPYAQRGRVSHRRSGRRLRSSPRSCGCRAPPVGFPS